MFASRPYGTNALCSSLTGGLIIAACAALSGCSSVTEATRSMANSIAPYKIEIVQGNFVSKEQVEALKTGMTRAQVREVLGTPLLQSVFHSDRWDYVFTMKRQGLEPQARQLTLRFNNDVLAQIEGDQMPSESEFVTLLGANHKVKAVPLLEASEDRLKDFAPPAAAAAAAPAAAAPQASAPPPPASYPPLEPAAAR